MILFDVAYELSLGSAWAYAEKRNKNKKCFARGLLFSALFHIPTCVTGFVAWQDWQMMGFFKPMGLYASGLLGGLSILILFVAYAAGFYFLSRLWAWNKTLLFIMALVLWAITFFMMGISRFAVFGPMDRTLFLLITGAINIIGFAIYYWKTLSICLNSP